MPENGMPGMFGRNGNDAIDADATILKWADLLATLILIFMAVLCMLMLFDPKPVVVSWAMI